MNFLHNSFKAISILLLITSSSLYAQSVKTANENNFVKDSIRITNLLSSARQYASFSIDSSLKISIRAINEARERQQQLLEADALIGYSQILIYQGDYKLALRQSILSIDKNRRSKSKRLAKSYAGAGWCYYWLAENNTAIKYLDSALFLYRKIADTQGIISTIINKGTVFTNAGKYSNALDELLYAEQLLQYKEAPHEAAKCFASLGEIYTEMQYPDKGLYYFKKNLELSRKHSDTLGIYGMYNNIGNILYSQKKYKDAIDYYLKSIDLSRIAGNSYMEYVCCNNLGALFEDSNSIDNALVFYKRAFDGFTKIGNNEWIGKELINIGKIEMLSASTQKHGVSMLEKGLEKVKAVNDKKYIVKAARLLADFYESAKQNGKANRYMGLYSLYSDSLRQEDVSKRLQELQFNNTIKLKQSEISGLEKDKQLAHQKIKLKNIMLSVLIAGLLTLSVFLYWLSLKNRKIIAQKKEIELQANRLGGMNFFKDRILSILSHDVRSPLASIKALFYLPIVGDDNELLCKEILTKSGWYVETTKRVGDQGVDLIAIKNDFRIAIQCKRYSTHWE